MLVVVENEPFTVVPTQPMTPPTTVDAEPEGRLAIAVQEFKLAIRY